MGGASAPPTARKEGNMRYIVTFARLGGAVIEAESIDEARQIAGTLKYEEIVWDDDYPVTDVDEF